MLPSRFIGTITPISAANICEDSLIRKKHDSATFASPAGTRKLTSEGKNFRYGRLVSLFVALAGAYAMRPALAADPALTPIKSITKAMAGQVVTVQAPISSIKEPSSARAPYLVNLTQDGATLPLIYWSDMQPQVAAKVKVGNTIRVTAAVNIYREQLQLKLSDPSALNVIGPDGNIVPMAAVSPAVTTPPAATTPATTTPAAEAVTTVIGAIKPDWTGRIVIISGTISASAPVDKSQHLSVQDATGEKFRPYSGKRCCQDCQPPDLPTRPRHHHHRPRSK